MPTVTLRDARGQKAISLQGLTAGEWHELFGNGEKSGTPEIETLAEVVGWMYRCIHLRASSASSLPWTIYNGDDAVAMHDGQTEDQSLSWIDGLGDLLYLTEAALSICGCAYWYLIRDRRGRIIEPRWFAPGTMTPRWDVAAGLTHFERQLGSVKTTYQTDDIVYTRLPNAMHETRPGSSPAKAAASQAGVLFNLDAFAEGYFERGAIRATLLTVSGNVRPDEAERLKSWWQRMVAGVSNAWGTGVINADTIKPVTVGDGIEALSNTDLTREKREGISTAMGVPHALVMSNAANYATAQSDKRLFYEGTVIPQSRLIAQAINRQLLAPLGLHLRFEPQTLPIFQDDEKERSTAYMNYVQAGMQPSVAAQVLGIALPGGMEYAELDTPDVTFAVTQEQHQQRQRAQLPGPSDDADDADGDEGDAAKRTEIGQLRRWLKRKGADADLKGFEALHLSGIEKRAVWTSIYGENVEDGAAEDTPFTQAIQSGRLTREAWKALRLSKSDEAEQHKLRMVLESAFAVAMGKELRKWLSAILPRDATNDDVRGAEGRVRQTSGGVRDLLRRFLGLAASLGINWAIDEFESVGIGFDYSLAHTTAAEWAAQNAGTLITKIEASTERSVRAAVSEWFVNDEPLSELRKELVRMGFDDRRAEMIATTETTNAAAEGSRIAYKESGVVDEWEWLTVNDEIVRRCPVCWPLHKVRAPLDQSFVHPENGNEYIPAAHPRCRCRTAPVIADA